MTKGDILEIQLRTGFEANLSGERQLFLGLQALLGQPGERARIEVIRKAVESKMDGAQLSRQGKQTLAAIISREAVEREYVLPFKQSRPYWQLTTKGKAYVQSQTWENGGETVPPDGLSFDPEAFVDEREWTILEVAQRPGQAGFRAALIARYGSHCLVSGCNVDEVIQAAHIFPYRGDKTDDPLNGILLRSDIHQLFDSGLLRIDPVDLRIDVAPTLEGSEYMNYHGKTLLCDVVRNQMPSRKALNWRWNWASSKDLYQLEPVDGE
ncbi:hypothetical protein D3C72_425560 [compost metagenome]